MYNNKKKKNERYEKLKKKKKGFSEHIHDREPSTMYSSTLDLAGATSTGNNNMNI